MSRRIDCILLCSEDGFPYQLHLRSLGHQDIKKTCICYSIVGLSWITKNWWLMVRTGAIISITTFEWNGTCLMGLKILVTKWIISYRIVTGLFNIFSPKLDSVVLAHYYILKFVKSKIFLGRHHYLLTKIDLQK